jgi:hypothetical protein
MNESFCNCGNPKKNHYPMEHMKGMWDSSEGQTHSYEDDCVPAHEKPKEPRTLSATDWEFVNKKSPSQIPPQKRLTYPSDELPNPLDTKPEEELNAIVRDFTSVAFVKVKSSLRERIQNYTSRLVSAREKELNVQWLITMNEAIAVDVAAAKKEEQYRAGEKDKELIEEAHKDGYEAGWNEASRMPAEKECIKQTRASVLTQVKEGIEKMYGEKGKMTGSFGYQGLVMGITAFERPEDKIRDDILSLIEAAEKE